MSIFKRGNTPYILRQNAVPECKNGEPWENVDYKFMGKCHLMGHMNGVDGDGRTSIGMAGEGNGQLREFQFG